MNAVQRAVMLIETHLQDGLSPQDVGEILVYAVAILSIEQGEADYKTMTNEFRKSLFSAKVVLDSIVKENVN